MTKDEATSKYLTDEWSAVTKALWNALEGRWLSSPFAILRAEDKPRQLTLASQLGLDIPETLISNNFAAASAFVADGKAIGKPLRHSLVERGEAGEGFCQSNCTCPIDSEFLLRLPAVQQANG